MKQALSLTPVGLVVGLIAFLATWLTGNGVSTAIVGGVGVGVAVVGCLLFMNRR